MQTNKGSKSVRKRSHRRRSQSRADEGGASVSAAHMVASEGGASVPARHQAMHMTTFMDADANPMSSSAKATPFVSSSSSPDNSLSITWPTPIGLQAMEEMEQGQGVQASTSAFGMLPFDTQDGGPPLPSLSRDGHDTSSFTTTTQSPASSPSPRSTLVKRYKRAKSHARNRGEGHIKRPPNAFILFRSHAYANKLIPNHLQVKDHREVSRIIAHMWNSLPTDERAEWTAAAQKEKELHRMRYPGYKYKPEPSIVREATKPKRNLKQPEDVAEKCEAIADNILRSYGRQGVQTTISESKAEKYRRKMKSDDVADDEPSQAVSSTDNGNRRTRSNTSKQKDAGSSSGRGVMKGSTVLDGKNEFSHNLADVQAVDAIVDRSLARMRALTVSQHTQTASPPASFDEIMSILASDAAQTQGAIDVGQPTAEVLHAWSTDLHEAAGFAAGTNVFNHPYAQQQHEPLARCFSTENALQQQQQEGGGFDSALHVQRGKTKRRPEKLNLMGTFQGPSADSRTYDSVTVPPPLSAARLWNFYGASYMDPFNSINATGLPSASMRSRTCNVLRQGTQDAMLVSPINAAFADQRQRFRLLTEAQQQQHLENVRQRSRVLQAADVALPVMQSRTLNSAAWQTTSFPLTPATARHDGQTSSTRTRFAALFDGSRRNSAGIDTLNLSPRLDALDLEMRSAAITDDLLHQFPITPGTALFSGKGHLTSLPTSSMVDEIPPISPLLSYTSPTTTRTTTSASQPGRTQNELFSPTAIIESDMRLAYSAAPASASKSAFFARRESIGARYAVDRSFAGDGPQSARSIDFNHPNAALILSPTSFHPVSATREQAASND